MMLRGATQAEVRKVVNPLWLLINSTSWPGNVGSFDPIKNGASSIMAHLAYCAIGADERERKNRAKVVPSRVFTELLAAADFDFVATLAGADLNDVSVVRTRFYVAVIVPIRTFLFIGVRGTQFAYDWLINLKIAKRKDESGIYFHVGFLREAEELATALRECLRHNYSSRLEKGDCALYLSGHSLGGAIAAILNQMKFPAPIYGCYIFGAPKISNKSVLGESYEPFATRRNLDIVPHCPPAVFNYADFHNQKATDGGTFAAAGGPEMYFFTSWLFGLGANQFLANHSMERYRMEVLEPIKLHPSVKPYWKYDDLPL